MKMVVLTHDGIFHADEVFAIAMIKLFHQDVEVIRSRSRKDYHNFDFIIDVGRVFDESKKMFDHHQIQFTERRLNGIPFASAGLILRYLFRGDEEILKYLDENLIQSIDAGDSGKSVYESEIPLYTISRLINSMNPVRRYVQYEDKCFAKAVDLAFDILKREIARGREIIRGTKVVKERIEETKEEYIILPEPNLPFNPIIPVEKIKFIVFQEKKDKWLSVGCPTYVHFHRKAYFPKSWSGLEGEELEKETGVPGAIFCHKHVFIIGAKTKEAILELTKLALKNQSKTKSHENRISRHNVDKKQN